MSLSVRLLAPATCFAVLLGASALSAVRLVSPVVLPRAAAAAANLEPAASPMPNAQSGDAEPAAVSADPFRAERRPSAVAFRMPGEALAGGAANQAETPQAIVLIGTAVQSGGGFAMCQIGSEPARLVRLGERLAGYTLRAVGQGRATFRTATGQLIEVRVARTGT